MGWPPQKKGSLHAIVQLSERAVEQGPEFGRRTPHRFDDRSRLVAHGDRLHAAQSGLDLASHIVVAALGGAVLVGQVDFQPRDARREATETILEQGFQLLDQRMGRFGVIVAIDLDLHVRMTLERGTGNGERGTGNGEAAETE